MVLNSNSSLYFVRSVIIATDRAQDRLSIWNSLYKKVRTTEEEKRMNEISETLKTDLDYVFEDLDDLQEAIDKY